MEFHEPISSEFRVALSERQDFLKEWITRCLEGPVIYRVASAPVVDSMKLEVKQLSDLTEKENMFTDAEKLEFIAAIRSPGDQGNNWKHYSNPLVPILRERLSNPPKVQVYHPESIVGELFHGPNNGVSPLREEENVDSNSIDSSNTMRVSTSLLSANAVGKCSNLHMTCCGFSKEAGEKTPHVAINPFQILVEEKTELYSSGPSEITVFSSPRLAGPSIFNFSGLSGWPIPSSSSNSSSLWILDSGAARHACCSKASFEPFVPTSDFVILPNGDTVPVEGTGSVRLCDDLTLQNVLFVPLFHCNLLSISALTQQYPYDVRFSSDQYVIEDRTQDRRRIAIGKREGNLYILDLSKKYIVFA